MMFKQPEIPQKLQVENTGGLIIDLSPDWEPEGLAQTLATFFPQVELELHGARVVGGRAYLLISGPAYLHFFAAEVLRVHVGPRTETFILADSVDSMDCLADLYNLVSPAPDPAAPDQRSFSTLDETAGKPFSPVLVGLLSRVPGQDKIPPAEYGRRLKEAMLQRPAGSEWAPGGNRVIDEGAPRTVAGRPREEDPGKLRHFSPELPPEAMEHAVAALTFRLPRGWELRSLKSALRKVFSEAPATLHGAKAANRTLRVMLSGTALAIVGTEAALGMALNASSDLSVLSEGADPLPSLANLYGLHRRGSGPASSRLRRRTGGFSTMKETLGDPTTIRLGVRPLPGYEDVSPSHYRELVRAAIVAGGTSSAHQK